MEEETKPGCPTQGIPVVWGCNLAVGREGLIWVWRSLVAAGRRQVRVLRARDG